MWTGFRPDTALIVVDMQNDFVHPWGTLRVRGAEEVLNPLNRAIQAAERTGAPVVYSKDWHPESTRHFRHRGGPWPPHCVRDSWGAALVSGLVRASPSIELHKGTGEEDGYSAFTVIEPDGTFRDTGLAALLRRLGVRTVMVGGVATDYCVKHTAIDAARLGFETTVALDAIRAVDVQPGDGARALEEMAAAV